MKNVVVLSSGSAGGPIAREMSKDSNYSVTVIDISQTAIDRIQKESNVTGICADLSNTDAVIRIAKDFDFVISAVPNPLSYKTTEALIEAGKNVADISTSYHNRLNLVELAKRKGVTVVYDIGVAPGAANVLMGHAVSMMDEPEEIVQYIGSLPAIRKWPYEYALPFSGDSLLEGLNASARRVENGEIVVRPPLSDVELINFPGLGTLEAFNSDGLCSLTVTKIAPNILEKTIRYPGHAEKMRILRDTGFFGSEPVDIKGTFVKPCDLTATLLESKLKLKPDENELTVFRVTITGKKDGRRIRYIYDMLTYRDIKGNYSSMNQVIAFPCVIMAKMIASGEFNAKGVFPPEYLGKFYPEVYKKLFSELAKKGIHYNETIEFLD